MWICLLRLFLCWLIHDSVIARVIRGMREFFEVVRIHSVATNAVPACIRCIGRITLSCYCTRVFDYGHRRWLLDACCCSLRLGVPCYVFEAIATTRWLPLTGIEICTSIHLEIVSVSTSQRETAALSEYSIVRVISDFTHIPRYRIASKKSYVTASIGWCFMFTRSFHRQC